jgi:hypothetical protein
MRLHANDACMADLGFVPSVSQMVVLTDSCVVVYRLLAGSKALASACQNRTIANIYRPTPKTQPVVPRRPLDTAYGM